MIKVLISIWLVTAIFVVWPPQHSEATQITIDAKTVETILRYEKVKSEILDYQFNKRVDSLKIYIAEIKK